MVPAVVHAGQEKAVRAARQQVLKEAYEASGALRTRGAEGGNAAKECLDQQATRPRR